MVLTDKSCKSVKWIEVAKLSVGFCEYGDELSGYIKAGNFLTSCSRNILYRGVVKCV
jgi:hypothetical protein